MGLADLINDQNLGPDVVLGKNMQKAMPYFIQSVKINLAGNNAFSKVQRDQNITASLKLLIVIANRVAYYESAKKVASQFTAAVIAQLEAIKGENNAILTLKQKCLNAWDKLNKRVEQRQRGQAQQTNEPAEPVELNERKRSPIPGRREASASPGSALPSKFAQLPLLNATKRAKSSKGRASPARPTLADRRNDMKAKKAAQLKQRRELFGDDDVDQLLKEKYARTSNLKELQDM